MGDLQHTAAHMYNSFQSMDDMVRKVDVHELPGCQHGCMHAYMCGRGLGGPARPSVQDLTASLEALDT
eukprot:350255-Chlamydomonas_euryale.AAC.27